MPGNPDELSPDFLLMSLHQRLIIAIMLGINIASCSREDSEAFYGDVVYDQGLHELHALTSCYGDISSGVKKSLSECSAYAQFHAKLYSHVPQERADLAACAFARSSLGYALARYPNYVRLKETEMERGKRNCSADLIGG